MAKNHFNGEDKRALRAHVRNLPVFPKLNMAGEFIFNKARMRGDKAIHRGYRINTDGKPLDPRGYYIIPISNVLEYPYEWFLKKLRALDEPITETVLDNLTREYLAYYERVAKLVAATGAGV